MLYVIFGLYMLQAVITVYLMFVVNSIERRIKDLEGHLFDV